MIKTLKDNKARVLEEIKTITQFLSDVILGYHHFTAPDKEILDELDNLLHFKIREIQRIEKILNAYERSVYLTLVTRKICDEDKP